MAKRFIAVTVAVGWLLSFSALSLEASSKPMVRDGKTRNFVFSYQVTVPAVPAGSKRLNMWIPVPTDNEAQTITNISIDSPVPVEFNYDPDFGNGMLYLTISHPSSKGFVFTAKYDVSRQERKTRKFSYKLGDRPKGEGLFTRYLGSSSKAVINDTVKRFAKEATKGKTTDLEKAKAIYDFVFAKMNYSKEIPGWGNGDVNRVCLSIDGKGEGYGNCTDFHSLFGSMMRSVGIPVKFEMGYPLEPGKNQDLKPGGYHCWAKFYIAGYGWIPVDISEARKDPSKKGYFWGSICENRLRFSTGRDIMLVPAQKGPRLNYFGPDPYIEIDGKAFEGFERKIGYKNI